MKWAVSAVSAGVEGEANHAQCLVENCVLNRTDFTGNIEANSLAITYFSELVVLGLAVGVCLPCHSSA